MVAWGRISCGGFVVVVLLRRASSSMQLYVISSVIAPVCMCEWGEKESSTYIYVLGQAVEHVGSWEERRVLSRTQIYFNRSLYTSGSLGSSRGYPKGGGESPASAIFLTTAALIQCYNASRYSLRACITRTCGYPFLAFCLAVGRAFERTKSRGRVSLNIRRWNETKRIFSLAFLSISRRDATPWCLIKGIILLYTRVKRVFDNFTPAFAGVSSYPFKCQMYHVELYELRGRINDPWTVE